MGPGAMGPVSGMGPGGMGPVAGTMGPGAGGRPGPYPNPAVYMAQKRAVAASQQFSSGPGGGMGPQMAPSMCPQVSQAFFYIQCAYHTATKVSTFFY